MKIHPHGDSSIHGAIASLMNCPNPLCKGDGNWGDSLESDPPAAYRYTECKTSELFEALIDDYDPELVPYQLTHDDNDLEPSLLPYKLPIPLLIGISGIAVGIATEIPAFHIDTVKQMVLKELGKSTLQYTPQYAYGSAAVGNLLVPIYTQKGNKFTITDLPHGTSIMPLKNHDVFKSLISAGLLTFHNNVSLDPKTEKKILSLDFICSDYIFFNYILGFLTRRVVDNTYYIAGNRIHHTVATFITDWVAWRKEYLKGLHMLQATRNNIKAVRMSILNHLGQLKAMNKPFQDYIPDIVKEHFDDYEGHFKVNVKRPDLKEITSIINESSISSIKIQNKMPYYQDVVAPDNQVIIDQMAAEIIAIDSTMFSKPTVARAAILAAAEEKFKKFVSFSNGKVTVGFKPVPRIKNVEMTDVLIFKADGSYYKLKNLETGEYDLIDDQPVVGFGYPTGYNLFVTKANQVTIRNRGFSLGCDLKNVIPLADQFKTDKGIIDKKHMWKHFQYKLKPSIFEYITLA
jgi:hypothetical protein